MLRLTADVNGHVIGYLYIHNTGHIDADGSHIYNAAFYDPATRDGVCGLEGVPHPRPEGWAMLVFRVLRRYLGDAK